jgi:hypothetical protein
MTTSEKAPPGNGHAGARAIGGGVGDGNLLAADGQANVSLGAGSEDVAESATGADKEVALTGRKEKQWDPFEEWDVITATTDGGVIWRRYGDGLLVVTRRDEMPDQALARYLLRESGNDRKIN